MYGEGGGRGESGRGAMDDYVQTFGENRKRINKNEGNVIIYEAS